MYASFDIARQLELLLWYMAYCSVHMVLWDDFVSTYMNKCPCSLLFSKVDIFVAAWSMTDSFCCRYPRIFDGREDYLRETVTYLPRCGRHFLCVIASEAVPAWPLNALWKQLCGIRPVNKPSYCASSIWSCWYPFPFLLAHLHASWQEGSRSRKIMEGFSATVIHVRFS